MKVEGFHNGSNRALIRADKRSKTLVLQMFSDMATLVDNQKSIACIARYMIACFNYPIQTIVIGSHPYPDHIVPYMGSSYSQASNTNSTPTLSIIGAHFSDNGAIRQDIVRSVRESWRLLPCGYAWFNATYANPSACNSSDSVEDYSRYLRTIEFICTLILDQKNRYNRSQFKILAIGKDAQFVASQAT
jgi:hypothetical protein